MPPLPKAMAKWPTGRDKMGLGRTIWWLVFLQSGIWFQWTGSES